jgi:hypothetical protein
MINWSLLLARLFSAVMSWLQASNLRNQMYILKDKNEIMRTALEDIQRMDSEGRMGWHAKITLDRIDERES